jgi:Cu-Zn family superoxide dismutase
MRIRTRSRALGIGIVLTVGLLATAAGAIVASGAGEVTANPGFAPNATDAVNPTIGASARAHVVVNGGRGGQALVTFHVDGLPAGRSFAAHLHRDSCATAFGGPHYQAPDPAHPVAANADPDHEVWLDFTANDEGRAQTLAIVPFEVLSGARAVVIHQGDHTPPGGVAGQRLACLDIEI